MYRKLTILLTLLISVFSINPAFGFEVREVIEFLNQIALPEVIEKLYQEVSRDKNNASSWVVEHEGVVYSLSAVEIRKDDNSFVQSSLNNAALRISSMRAAANLAIYLDEGRTDTKNFTNKIAVANVLRIHYEAKIKFNSASKIINNTAFTLVCSNKINLPMPAKEFNKNYCLFLYEQAQDFFMAENFSEALKTFHQIHYMAWANIDAYLGASLCFLKMNQKDDAAKLASELINVFSKDMKPDEMANAGKILFNAGKKDEGFNALEEAYKMLISK